MSKIYIDRVLLYVFFFIIVCSVFSTTAGAYNKLYEFDENEKIVISTVVYNQSGKPCLNCTCNLTVYNPYPNERFINISIQLKNYGNGIYSINLSDHTSLTYNKYIYPMTLVCNDSSGYFGGDDREGIKVSETVFDYTSGVLAVIGVAIGLLIMSFRIDKRFDYIKKFCFFASLGFFFSALALGYAIFQNSPASNNFIIIMNGTITIFIMSVFVIIFLYFKQRIIIPVERIGKGRF